MAIFRRDVTWWIVIQDLAGIIALYWLGLAFMHRPLFLQIVNSIMVTMTVVVVVVYGIRAIESFYRDGISRVAVISIGISWSWLITGTQAITRGWFMEMMPQVTGRTFDFLGGLPAVGYIIGLALHILAIGIENQKVDRRSACTVVWSILAGIALVPLVKILH